MNQFVCALLICSAGLSDCSGKSAAPQRTGTSDTIILGSRQQVITFNTSTPYYQAAISLPGNKLPAGKKIWLVLDDVSVPEAPDGVYELFVSGSPHGLAEPHSPKETFTTVLDIYALTAEQQPSQVTADITKKVAGLLQNNLLPGTLYIAIRFTGNELPDKSASKATGTINIKGMQVLMH